MCIRDSPYTTDKVNSNSAVAVHLICGIWGTLAVGIFGELAGLDQILVQLAGIGIIGAFSAISATIIILIVKAVTGGSIRVSKEEELKGLDTAEHGMSAYADF